MASVDSIGSYRNVFISRYPKLLLNRIFSISLFIIFSLLVIGCEAKRPPGFLTIGKVSEVATKTHFIPEMNFYLIRDPQGVAIMSTLCRYDRLPLKLINENGITSNWQYRRYLTQNANSIMKTNFRESANDVGYIKLDDKQKPFI
jgi:hypothetical protein